MSAKLFTIAFSLTALAVYGGDPVLTPVVDNDSARALYAREYRVSPRFMEWLERREHGAYDLRPLQARDFHTSSGEPFVYGPTALYVPSSRKLIVNHTKGVHVALSKLIAQWQKARFSGEPPSSQLLEEMRKSAATWTPK